MRVARLETKRVIEMRVFLPKADFKAVFAHFARKGKVTGERTIKSYYFDAFHPTNGRFVLQGARGKYRFRERTDGGRTVFRLQGKARTAATTFPTVDGYAFSVRRTQAWSQDLAPAAARKLRRHAQKAAEAFDQGHKAFAEQAARAGQTFTKAEGAYQRFFHRRLGERKAKAEHVSFAGLLTDTRTQLDRLFTRGGVGYTLELDRFKLATAPGKSVREFSLEASIEPSRNAATTRKHVREVMHDVVRRLKAIGVQAEAVIPARKAASDPLGPTGGYMAPVRKVLAGR